MEDIEADSKDVEEVEVNVPFEGEQGDLPEIGLRGTRGTIGLMLIFWILSAIFRNVGQVSNFAKSYVICEGDMGKDCERNSVIYRSAIAVLIVLVVQAILSLCSTGYFDKYWLIKYLLTILIAFALLYPKDIGFDNDSFAWVARVFAFVFICLQALVFLDFAYNFNEKIVSKAMSGGAVGTAATRTFENTVGSDVAKARKSCNLLLLLIFSSLSLGVLITTMALLYKYYGGSECEENVSVITISFVGALVCCLVQLFISSNGSILTSAIVGLYVSYLTFCSVSLNPKQECNSSLANSAGEYGVGPMVIGLILSFLSIFFVAAFTSRSIVKFLATDLPLKNLLSVVLFGTNSGVSYSITGTVLDFEEKLRSILLWFTVVFTCMTFYIAMVMTNWGTAVSNNELVSSVAAGNVSMFMNAAGAWVCLAFYLLALLVPRWKDCCPSSVWDLKP